MKSNLVLMSPESLSATLTCPAKINLTLAILGLREDRFHDLHSIVALTDFGDELTLDWSADGTSGGDRVVIEGAVIPEGVNSVLAAIRLFRRKTGFHEGSLVATLSKKIPIGAGLGGGSSDAAMALKALAGMFPELATGMRLEELALEIGSDCPLFLSDRPVLMEGRGERITLLEDELVQRLKGQPVILFKPGFSINTAEAYRRLAALQLYHTPEAARGAIAEWKETGRLLPGRMNDFERLLGHWIPTIPLLLGKLRDAHGIDARLSGSGSACFAFPEDDSSAKSKISEEMERAWGEVCWIEEIHLK